MKTKTEQLLRKLVREEYHRLKEDDTAFANSIAGKIFRKYGLRYGSLWARTDDQDEKINA